MFRDEPPDPRQDVTEVGQVKAAERLPPWRREFQYHEARPWLQHPRRLPEPRIEVHQIAHPEANRGPVEDAVFEREVERIRRRRAHPRRLPLPTHQHGRDKVGGHHPAPERSAVAQFGGKVLGPGTEVEVGPGGGGLPVEAVHGRPAPALVGVEREDVVEQVVAGSDLGEDAAYIRTLGIAARDR
jgi:hypothetical protein